MSTLRRRSARSSRRGATAVEFAIVAPVLLLLTFAVVDYGWYFTCIQGVDRVAREAARVGGQTPLDMDPVGTAQSKADALIAGTFPANQMPHTTSAVVNGDHIEVAVSVEFSPLVGFVPTPSTYSVTYRRYLERL